MADAGHIEMDDTRQFVTGVACKAVGGKWFGGHDISGHVFLLVLGSMFLFEEVLHVAMKSPKTKEQRTILMNDGAVKSAEIEAETEAGTEPFGGWTVGSKITLGVGTMSVYMLFMTAAFFHTWFEKVIEFTNIILEQADIMKFTGLLVAFSGIFVVYFLPRMIPILRSIVGMPGV